MYGVANPAIAAPKLVPLNLEGKHVLVVGGTAGIGRSLAVAAARASANVTVVGRTFRDDGVPNLQFVRLDAESLAACAQTATSLGGNWDLVVFTNGIVAAKQREVTQEGLEKDMAVSAFSRYVFLSTLLPTLKAGAKIAVWGMPGNNQKTDILAHLDDLNAEKGYEPDFGFVHLNTVMVNEALVLHVAAQKGAQYTVVGMNPGLIRTEIRGQMHGNGCFGSFLECCISCWNPTTDEYASHMLQLLSASDVPTGSLWGQKGTAIVPSTIFTNDAGLAAKVVANAAATIEAKTGIKVQF